MAEQVVIEFDNGVDLFDVEVTYDKYGSNKKSAREYGLPISPDDEIEIDIIEVVEVSTGRSIVDDLDGTQEDQIKEKILEEDC